MRLSIRLDPLLAARESDLTDVHSLTQAAAVAALAGADGIVMPTPSVEPDRARALVQRARDAFDGPLALACPLREEPLRVALEARPDVAVLIGRQGAFRPLDGDDLTSQSMRDAAQALTGARLPFAVYIVPNLTRVKAVRQLGAEFVILSAEALRAAPASDQAIQAIESLETAALGASKLGLRVLVSGNLDRHTLKTLRDLNLFEEAILGRSFVYRALLQGLPSVLGEFR